MIQFVAQCLMDLDVEALCGAGYGIRSDERSNSHNGYRDRLWQTRAGDVERCVRAATFRPSWSPGAAEKRWRR